ncbi:hypothetical protein KEJ27_10530 [Candidatus Bathyarchaeota archaeon]|nr:hypothetical protein [Candidatus Bathyarchaeota archaeon]
MGSLDDLWRKWLGPSREGLEFTSDGRPFRILVNTVEELKKLIDKHQNAKQPIYLSVQPYESLDKPSHIERVFFEFDDKEDPEKAIREALWFSRVLKRFYHVEPFIVKSGGKGAHVYVFLKEPVFINGLEEEVKETYKRLQEKLLKGVVFSTLDNHVIGDIKRLSRVPYTLHEKTGSLCQPMDFNGRPINAENLELEFYRRNGLEVELLGKTLREVVEEAEKRKQSKHIHSSFKGLRSEIKQLITLAREGIDLSHEERLAILFELLNAGYPDEDIHGVFVKQPDYKHTKTQYFIDHARKHGYKPFSKRRLRQILEKRGGLS